MKLQPLRFVKFYYLKFLRLQGDPKSLARGVAIGTSTGLAPIIPFHTISVLILSPIFRGNIAAAFLAAVATCNPITYFPQYYISWLIGNWLTPYDLSWDRISFVMKIALSDAGFKDIFLSLSALGADTIIVLLVGGAVFALPCGIVSYFLSLRFFTELQKQRSLKHVLS
jgi:hypothetical protein